MIVMREIGTQSNAGPFRKPKGGRGGWLGFQTAKATTTAGAPSFAYFAKGGYDDGIHNGRCGTDKSCAGSIAIHPRKKRKDGAPSRGMAQCRDGLPAKTCSARKKA